MLESKDSIFLKLLGKRILLLRKNKGLSQRDLAYKIGMETSNLSVIENGKSNPQIITLVKIASALQITLTELIDFEFEFDSFLEVKHDYVPRKHTK